MGGYLSNNKEDLENLNNRFINIKANLENEKIKNVSLHKTNNDLEKKIIELKCNTEEITNEFNSKENYLKQAIKDNEKTILNNEDIITKYNINKNELENENNELKKNKNELENQINELEKKNNELKNNKNKIINENNILNKNIKILENKIITCETIIDNNKELNDKINKHNLELINDTDELSKQNNELSKQNNELLEYNNLLDIKINNINTSISNLFIDYNKNNDNIINNILKDTDTFIPNSLELPFISNIFNSSIKIIKNDIDCILK